MKKQKLKKAVPQKSPKTKKQRLSKVSAKGKAVRSGISKEAKGAVQIDVHRERGEGVVLTKNKLSAKQKDESRKLLLRMRDRLSGQIASLKSESLEINDSINVEEDGTDVFDQQFALDIVSSENEMLMQIEEALDRINKQTYGVCEECGILIHDQRMKALPFVRTCITCQSKLETHGAARIRPSERLEEM